jgi:folate-binding Fe-S cluster repair protein YgfZ
VPDYRVTVAGEGPMMIRANNQAQARNYAVREKVKIESLTTEEAIRLAKEGQDLLDATAEPEAQSNGD